MSTAKLTSEHEKMRLKEKIVIIINGKGGAGKDTVCDIAALFFNSRNISAITPIKEIASQYGWNGEKDARSRKFLSDLKRVFIEYNDLPNNYLEEEYHKFINSENDILFIHIRESDQIDALRKRIRHKCVTLIVRSDKIDQSNLKYGNESDDNVDDYTYDYCYTNGKPLNVLIPDFMDFLYQLLATEGVITNESTSNLPWRSHVYLG